MEFWYIFFSFLIGLWMVMGCVNCKWRCLFTIVYLSVVIMVSGLRNYIGTDFPTYVRFYEQYAHAEFMGAMAEGMEPSFALLVSFLGELGGRYQVLFLVYSAITILGMYYGFKKWLRNDSLAVYFGMILYFTYNSTGGFWWGMNVIRQAAALSVAFAFSGYLIQKEKARFILLVGIAALFHYSALVFLPAVFLLKTQIGRRKMLCLLTGAIILTLSGLSKKIVLSFLSVGLGIIGKYEEALLLVSEGSKGFSYMSFVYVIMFVIGCFIIKWDNSQRNRIILNLSFVYIIMRVLTSFSLGGPSIQFILHRFEVYYMPFFLVLVAETMMLLMNKIKPKIIAPLIVSSFLVIMELFEIITIAKLGGYRDYPLEPNYPPDIVKYEMNIDLYE